MPDYKVLLRYRELLKPFEPDKGDLLAALHALQHEYGFVPSDAVTEVAKKLRMNASAVFGALSFYSEFRTTPPPKNMVMWLQRARLPPKRRRQHPPRFLHHLGHRDGR